MNIEDYSARSIGILGERVAAEYLRRQGFFLRAKNIRATFGELDIIAFKEQCLHIVEVKSLRCVEFPGFHTRDQYDPGENLHQHKIRKVVRTAKWYVEKIQWEGEWQVDGALVWLRERDGMAKVRYFPQII